MGDVAKKADALFEASNLAAEVVSAFAAVGAVRHEVSPGRGGFTGIRATVFRGEQSLQLHSAVRPGGGRDAWVDVRAVNFNGMRMVRWSCVLDLDDVAAFVAEFHDGSAWCVRALEV